MWSTAGPKTDGAALHAASAARWHRADGDQPPPPPAVRASAAAPLGAPTARKRDAFKDEEERIWRGADAATLVRDVLGLENAERVDEHCKMLWKMRKDLIDEGLESGAVRSDTINDLEAILVKLRYLLDPAAATRYKLIATSAPRRDVFPKGATRAARGATR